MRTGKFDAYGEVLPDAGRGKREAGRAVSAILGSIGRYVFWLAVVMIVSARILLYPTTPAFEAGSASEPRLVVTR